MTSTPPVNTRINTPPTPLHGAKYSSPRHTRSSSSLGKPENFASPPNSPSKLLSPGKETHDVEDKKQRKGKERTITAASTDATNGDPFGSMAAPSPAKKLRFKVPQTLEKTNPFQKAPQTSNGAEAYPTPAKTPSRKRKFLPQSQIAELGAASRVLFGAAGSSTSASESVNESGTKSARSTTATATTATSTSAAISEVEEILSAVRSSPKKKRKGSRGPITVDPFCEPQDLNDRGRRLGNGGEIQIYTDSNERIPEYDPSPENPFIDHPEDTQEGGSDPEELKRKLRKRRAETKEEFKKAGGNREDGMLYMFRGKKIFRKFEKDNSELLGRVQPRVLFPSAKQLRERQAASEEPDVELAEDSSAEEGVASDVDEVEDRPEGEGKGKGAEQEAEKEAQPEEKEVATPSIPKRNLRKTAAKITEKVLASKGKEKKEHIKRNNEDGHESEGNESEGEKLTNDKKRTRASSVAPSVSSASSTILNFGNRPKITKSVSNLSTNSENHNSNGVISGGSFLMVDGLRRSKRLYTEEHEHIQDARTALARKLAGGKRVKPQGEAGGKNGNENGNGTAGLDVERWAFAASGPTRKKSRN